MSEIEPNRGSVDKGAGIGVLLTVCWLVLALITISRWPAASGRAGLVLAPAEVLLLMVPAWYKYKADGETETAKGIVIVGAIVFLLSASCSALMLSFK